METEVERRANRNRFVEDRADARHKTATTICRPGRTRRAVEQMMRHWMPTRCCRTRATADGDPLRLMPLRRGPGRVRRQLRPASASSITNVRIAARRCSMAAAKKRAALHHLAGNSTSRTCLEMATCATRTSGFQSQIRQGLSGAGCGGVIYKVTYMGPDQAPPLPELSSRTCCPRTKSISRCSSATAIGLQALEAMQPRYAANGFLHGGKRTGRSPARTIWRFGTINRARP